MTFLVQLTVFFDLSNSFNHLKTSRKFFRNSAIRIQSWAPFIKYLNSLNKSDFLVRFFIFGSTWAPKEPCNKFITNADIVIRL